MSVIISFGLACAFLVCFPARYPFKRLKCIAIRDTGAGVQCVQVSAPCLSDETNGIHSVYGKEGERILMRLNGRKTDQRRASTRKHWGKDNAYIGRRMKIGSHSACERDAEGDLPELNARSSPSHIRKNQRI